MTPTNKILAAIALLGTVLFIRKNKPTDPINGIGALPKNKLFTGTYDEFIILSLSDKNYKGFIEIEVPKEKRKKVNNIIGYETNRFIIKADAMRHAQNSHKKDVDNGLLNLLPTIMNYGEVSPEIDTSRTGNLGVKFSARLNGEFAVAVWVEFFPFQEVHADDLTLKSIHIKKERLYK